MSYLKSITVLTFSALWLVTVVFAGSAQGYMQLQSSSDTKTKAGAADSVPTAPQNFTVTTAMYVMLAWNAPESDGGSVITKYQVQRDDDAWIDVPKANGNAYNFSPGTNGTTHTFQVRAVNSYGEGTLASVTKTMDYVLCRDWSTDKDDVFARAKEQDKFIVFLLGNDNCPHCRLLSDILGYNDNGNINPQTKGSDGPLRKFVIDNFIPWHSYSPGGNRNSPNFCSSNIRVYVNEILDAWAADGGTGTLPFVGVVNPYDTTKNILFSWGTYRPDVERTVEKYLKCLTINLLDSSTLTWHTDKNEALSLAKAQKKCIFRLVGKGTSPNSHQLIHQLNETQLKALLDKNFILWYTDASDASFDFLKSSDEEEEGLPQAFPFISIIHYEDPDVPCYQTCGPQEDEALEELLKSYPAANEVILSDNKVTVIGNSLQIANQTNNEQIYVYAVTGQRLASVYKKDYTAAINTSTFPKGMLIVYSSTGWSTKVLLQ